MGYTTWFSGSLTPNKPFTKEFTNYINAFNETRHIKYDVEKLKAADPKWAEHCLDGNLGVDGEFYVKPNSRDACVDYNTPPGSCPGLWCQWKIEGGEIVWDGGEKFYNYTEWLDYLIKNFFAPAGYVLNGEIRWEGEERDDNGIIQVNDNKMSIFEGTICYNDEEARNFALSKASNEELITEVRRRYLEI